MSNAYSQIYWEVFVNSTANAMFSNASTRGTVMSYFRILQCKFLKPGKALSYLSRALMLWRNKCSLGKSGRLSCSRTYLSQESNWPKATGIAIVAGCIKNAASAFDILVEEVVYQKVDVVAENVVYDVVGQCLPSLGKWDHCLEW